MYGMKKVKLLHSVSPFSRLDNLSKDLGVNLFIKRDDLAADIGMGGNKLRKLEYLVADALDKGATMLLTFGGAQTNHGRLTAASAAKCGLKCAIVAIDKHPSEMSGNILLDRLMGADVHIYEPDGTPDQEARVGEMLKAEYEKQGERVYTIPVGGSNVIGALGYMDGASEMYTQMTEVGIKDGVVACGAGSLGTYLGLWYGLKECLWQGDIMGIAISPFGDEKEARIVEYAREIAQTYKLPYTPAREDFYVETGYVREGYNIPDERVRKAMYTMASREAIILDPCYTGKAFAGILQMIEEGKIKKGTNVVFLHTGGAPAIYTPFHRVEMEKELSGRYFLK